FGHDTGSNTQRPMRSVWRWRMNKTIEIGEPVAKQYRVRGLNEHGDHVTGGFNFESAEHAPEPLRRALMHWWREHFRSVEFVALVALNGNSVAAILCNPKAGTEKSKVAELRERMGKLADESSMIADGFLFARLQKELERWDWEQANPCEEDDE